MNLPPRLAAVLREPPREFSPVAIWWWSGAKLDRRRLRWQLERFVAGGVHNLVVLNLAPTGPMFGSDADDPPFFSDEWWELLDGVCDDAAGLGARLWFYDQLGFSGADIQARLVEGHPEYAGQWLAPDGSVRTRGFDYLSTVACATLLDRVHGEFARRLGHHLGGAIAGSFQDELPALPTWSAAFASEFASRRGYELDPALLWTDSDPLIRRDYQLTRAELAEEAFFRPLADWHTRYGLLAGCDQQDPARAGDPVAGVQLYADYPRTHRWFSAPGSDHHGDARVHSSLSHLYGHPRTWIEAFHSSGWGGTLEETLDWLLPWLRAGATLYNPHAVYYTTKAGWWEWAPPSTDWRQPYWHHHRLFADTVTRLCAALSLGRHACDIAVLLPTATVQAGTRLDGHVSDDALRAQRVYRDLVGDLTWFHTVPGALDRLCREADVIDDDSVARADVVDGRLQVADEAYRAVILPACTVIDERVAARLDEFVTSGGTLIAVGTAPTPRVIRASLKLLEQREGRPDHAGLLAHFAAGRAHLVDDAAAVGPLLPAPPVAAPVPSLVRDVDGTRVVFITAAASRASDVSVGRPDERGISLGWLDARYDFDPARYHESVTVRVRDVPPHAVLADPFTGDVRALPCTVVDGTVEVRVPFDHGPAALIAFPPAHLPAQPVSSRLSSALAAPFRVTAASGSAAPASATALSAAPVLGTLAPADAASGSERSTVELAPLWTSALVSTMDDTWGDFGAAGTVERWTVRHRLDGDAEWGEAHATFGPHALRGSASPDAGTAPEPRGELMRTAGEEVLVYSTSRGIHKDPIHREVLGPKGHVPEEFLALGAARAGEPVRVRCDLILDEPVDGWLAVGAAAAKSGTLGGAALAFDDRGYLGLAPVRLAPGRHALALDLAPDEDLDLRAYIAVVRDATAFERPEWMYAGGPPRPGSTVTLRTTVTLRAEAEAAGTAGRLQVAAREALVIRLNGAEVGRQGGFEPYAEQATPRVRRYDLGDLLSPGRNEVAVEFTEESGAGAVLVDGVAFSGRHWTAERDGVRVETLVRRRQYGDPAALHLWRRPHPLPETAWLSGAAAGDVVVPTVLAVPAEAVQWFSFPIPPGATAMRLGVHGEADVSVDGAEVARGEGALAVDLGAAPSGPRTCVVRVTTRPGYSHGAALAGPVVFDVDDGLIGLGDWEEQGLAGFSGGVRYRQRFTVDSAGPATVDLGRVRGTAEVALNGEPLGARFCGPYRFAGAVRAGDNELEVVVYGTLAPYLDQVSPTHFVYPGQRQTGLFGPVNVIRASLK
ncbi:hypothetical protein [Phytohabitans aurantiacus]|uniref:Glycoside hydrolase n=1 Tax=Phytohabitans aurantiacus TaxID=3016789 RepID=A0ABQ5R3X5_9ACTN|nr:hypothetical protein [Phytohabitans aurantiacus]GLI01395.1 hypothetical protein Pa4123_66710 [Phytohabitans aurantiacus]